MTHPFISIQVPSNRPQQFIKFLDHIEHNATDPSSVEVIVNLDENDDVMWKMLDIEIAKRKIILKYIKTFTGGFYNSWKPINDMVPHTDPNVYFMTFLSDEFLFETKGWDDVLKRYVGYYPDHIFRLRASQFRYRNYIDYWECGFAPDSIAFYTKKWVDINKDWGTCFSSDAFQQCVAYYLAAADQFSKYQDNRDVPVPDLAFSGEGASIGLEGEKAKERVRGGLKAWFILMSYTNQLEASRRAMLLKAHIELYRNPGCRIVDDQHHKKIDLIGEGHVIIKSFSYKLNRLRIYLTSQYRKSAYLYYAGGGDEARSNPNHSWRFNLTYYFANRFHKMGSIHEYLNYVEGRMRNFMQKIQQNSDNDSFKLSQSSIKPDSKNTDSIVDLTKSYFFMTTYDSVTSSILMSLLNIHPQINCQTDIHDKFLPVTIKSTIDQFIASHQSTEHAFSGNINNFGAFELQHRSLVEKTKCPFRKINIILSPLLRIRFILHGWYSSGLTEDEILQRIQAEIADNMNKKNVFELYNIFYYFNHILSTVVSNLKEIEKMQANNVNSQCQFDIAELSSPRNKLFYLALAIVIAFDSADLPCTGKTFNFEQLLSDPEEYKNLLHYLSRDNISVTDDTLKAYQLKLQDITNQLCGLHVSPWEEWQLNIINSYMNTKLNSIYGTSMTKNLSELYASVGLNLSNTSEMKYNKLISIQLNSNRPAQLSAYFDNIEDTVDDPKLIEILINIDDNDRAMKRLLDYEKSRRQFTIKYITSPRPGSFCELWKPLNKLLQITDPEAYFLLNISDEMFFTTKGWDTVLKKYIGFFPDHIFRLRASRNKFRNYFDRWECSFAQDCITFTTRKWISIVGDWNPCFGPDSFQQLTSYYLSREGMFSNEQYLRDIPIIDIQFAGDIPALGFSPEKKWKVHSDSIRAMQICQSYPMQLEARKRAVLLKANIIIYDQRLANVELIDLKEKKAIQMIVNKKPYLKLSYKVNGLYITLSNQLRKLSFYNYFGEGIVNKKRSLLTFIQYLIDKHKSCLKAAQFVALQKNKYMPKKTLKADVKENKPSQEVEKV